MENRPISYGTYSVLLLIVIVAGVWASFSNRTPSGEQIGQLVSEEASSSEDSAVMATSLAVESEAVSNGEESSLRTLSVNAPASADIYSNGPHQFQFQYPSGWKKTDVLSYGIYNDAVIFVKTSEEVALSVQMQLKSESISQLVQDQALIIRVKNSGTLSQVISEFYGPGVVVTTQKINGRTVTKVVRSKSSDAANWTGGSVEAYIFKNTLGESLVVEANYSTPEPQTSGDLKVFLDAVVANFKLAIR